MPTAREALLDAAFTALAVRPWSGVRMVDVAAAAGVSRQTLYNEFGTKDGLARALVRREADGFLAGVERALAGRLPERAAGRGAGRAHTPAAARTAGPEDRLVAVAEWTVGAARANPFVRALLTGCWGDRLPAPRPARTVPYTAVSPVPAQRRADAGSPGPAELIAAVRDRALAALGTGRTKEEAAEVAYRCELVLRLALSYVLTPTAPADGFTRLLRRALAGAGQGGPGLSGPNPRAGGR
ncbi:TetR/AcrR family transcriptional regulator [Streptomyces albidochromogenes]|uniref:TetR/AcrR family transcriptional regulator n=1 Tax=Streptomyces albidochromogenes TaxID=329524 RepID=UPI00110F73C5|nr:TetR/AcrR family transcriptional regulator [Streptomyces albidochromogenes]